MKNHKQPVTGQDNPSGHNSPDCQQTKTARNTTPAESSTVPAARDNPKKYNDNEWKLIVVLMARPDPTVIQQIDGLLPSSGISPDKRVIFDAIIANHAELATPVISRSSSITSESRAFAESRLVPSGYFARAIKSIVKRGKSARPLMEPRYQEALKILRDPDLSDAVNAISGISWQKLVTEINTSAAAASLDSLKSVLAQLKTPARNGEEINSNLRKLVDAQIDLSKKVELLESIEKIITVPGPKGQDKPKSKSDSAAPVPSTRQPPSTNEVVELENQIDQFIESASLKDRLVLLKSIRATTIRLEAEQSKRAKEASHPISPLKERLKNRIIVPIADDVSPLRPRHDNYLPDTAHAGLTLANPSRTIHTDRLNIFTLAIAIGRDFTRYSNFDELVSSLTRHDAAMLIASVSEADVIWRVLLRRNKEVKLYAVSAQPGKLVLSIQGFNGAPLYALPLRETGQNSPERILKMSSQKLAKMFPNASYIHTVGLRNHNLTERASADERRTTRPIDSILQAAPRQLSVNSAAAKQKIANSDSRKKVRLSLEELRAAGHLYRAQSRPHLQLSSEFFALLGKHMEKRANSAPDQLTNALQLALTLCRLNPERILPRTQILNFRSVLAAWQRTNIVHYESVHAILGDLEIGEASANVTAVVIMQDRAKYRQTFVLSKRGSNIFFIDPNTTNLQPVTIRHILDLEDRAFGKGVMPVDCFLLRMDGRPNWSALTSPGN